MEDFDKKMDRLEIVFWLTWVASFLFAIALIGGGVYIGYHFLMKIW